MTLPAGKLRHRIQLQRFASTQDPNTGLIEESWTPVARVWAAVEPVSVKEFIAAGAAQATVDTRIMIRYRDDVDATCRAVDRGRVYDIHGALPDPVSGRDYMTLACTAGGSNG